LDMGLRTHHMFQRRAKFARQPAMGHQNQPDHCADQWTGPRKASKRSRRSDLAAKTVAQTGTSTSELRLRQARAPTASCLTLMLISRCKKSKAEAVPFIANFTVSV